MCTDTKMPLIQLGTFIKQQNSFPPLRKMQWGSFAQKTGKSTAPDLLPGDDCGHQPAVGGLALRTICGAEGWYWIGVI